MTRGQWTLVGLLVVQVMLIVVLRHPEAAGSTEPGALVPSFETSDVVRVELGTKPDERLVLSRDGSGWAITSAEGYPADASKVDDMISTIREARVRMAVVTSDKYHESLEVSEEKAQARIRLYRADSENPFVDLIVGKSAMGGAHVRVAGEEDVYDIRDVTPWQLRADTATWMQKTLVDIPTDSVQKLAIHNEHGSFELERSDDSWIITLPEESSGISVNQDKVNPIVRAAATLNVSGAAGRLDPSKQGLGDEAITVTLTHGEGTTTVRLGTEVPDKSGQIYVTRDGFGFAATQWETSFNSVKNAKLEELLP